ncbi:MAG: RDD domain containing protein [Candidatus Moranbacteria bacterium GW2011_GWF1_34_10]|nr:MAG: RDD domain containing protein [Candidatus Moranbacteria bacterium GW2011_GWF1_34_10]
MNLQIYEFKILGIWKYNKIIFRQEARNKKMENKINENQGSADNSDLNVPQNNPAPLVSEPVTNNENVSQSQVKYAGFWIRFVAVIIDGIIVFFISLPLIVIFKFVLSIESSGFLNLLSSLISWGYYIYMTDKYQATLGKKAMGIMVVDESLAKASLGNIVLRETVGKIVSAIILLIGYIMAAFTSKKRALHDLIAGTVVIYRN